MQRRDMLQAAVAATAAILGLKPRGPDELPGVRVDEVPLTGAVFLKVRIDDSAGYVWLSPEVREKIARNLRETFEAAGQKCPPVVVCGPGADVEAVHPAGPNDDLYRRTLEDYRETLRELRQHMRESTGDRLAVR